MTTEELVAQIHKKKSFLCIGLDVDLDKIPTHLLAEEDPIFAFNKAIIDATHHLAVAYKPNTAFYEAYGLRGDIGNTSAMYAKAFFEDLGFDSVTTAPYMGKDSIEPFLGFENKHTILLALTSNQGAFDFQTKLVDGVEVYKTVIETSKTLTNAHNLMYVVGATKASYLADIRKIVPHSFLLVPGVGAQGGSLSEVCKYGLSSNIGLLVNSSRGVIYAGKDKNFAKASATAARELQSQMEAILNAL